MEGGVRRRSRLVPIIVSVFSLSCCVALLTIFTGIYEKDGQQFVELEGDLVDPEGVNPQKLSDVLDDLEASAKSDSAQVRNLIAKTKKLMDKKLSVIVDTQTLKDGGLPGPEGPPGPKGPTGYQGAVGAEGDRGDVGIMGPPGYQGADGIPGIRGDTGPVGPQGPRGPLGPVGEQGYPGPVGPRGPMGTPGARGMRGPRGQAGYPGLPGAMGNPGIKGKVGAPGTYKAVQVSVRCKAIAGMMYRGICLKGSKIYDNVDQIPVGCDPYQPALGWTQDDFNNIFRMFGDYPHRAPGVSYWSRGGLCGNMWAIAGYSQRYNDNHVFVRWPTFNWQPSIYWNACWLKDYWSGGDFYAVYACRIWPG